MRLSVVVATLNRPEDLERTLRSVLRQTLRPLEVLVIDQSEDDRSLSVIHSLNDASVRHVRQIEKSLVKARNRGLLEAQGELVSFLDDDVELLNDYYEKIAEAFCVSDKIGAVGGSVISTHTPSGWKWAARRALMRFFLLCGRDGRMTASGFGYPVYERAIDRQVDVEMLHGCNMTFLREAIGTERFDEWFAGYGFREDAEFTYRISKHWTIRMIPQARLHHFESPVNRLDTERLKTMEMANYAHVFRQHKNTGFFSRLLFRWSVLGLVAFDVLEYLSRRNEAKQRKLQASWAAARKILRTL